MSVKRIEMEFEGTDCSVEEVDEGVYELDFGGEETLFELTLDELTQLRDTLNTMIRDGGGYEDGYANGWNDAVDSDESNSGNGGLN